MEASIRTFTPALEDVMPTVDAVGDTDDYDERALRRARLSCLLSQFSEAYTYLEPMKLRCKSRIRREVVDTAITVLAKLGRHDQISEWASVRTAGGSSSSTGVQPLRSKFRPGEFTDIVQKCHAAGDGGADEVFPELAKEIVAKPRCLYKWRALESLLRCRASVIAAAGHHRLVEQNAWPSGICVTVADYVSCAIVRILELRDRPTCSSQHLFRQHGVELSSVARIPLTADDLVKTMCAIFSVRDSDGSELPAVASLCSLMTAPVLEVFGGRGASSCLDSEKQPPSPNNTSAGFGMTN